MISIANLQQLWCAADSKQQCSGSSDDEEVGRSGAFGPKKAIQHPTHVTNKQQLPQKKKGDKQKAVKTQQP